MKSMLFPAMRALAVCLIALAPAAFAQDPYKNQDKPQPKAPQISEAEEKALVKVRDAADPAAKLLAAEEFVKKYPKSTRRAEVVLHVVTEISKMPDPAQQIPLLEKTLTVFNQPGDSDKINTILLDAYLKSNRIDDAFRITAVIVEKNPNDVVILTHMSLLGTDQAKAKNPKYVQMSQTWGVKAIELIEADKMPASMDAAAWTRYKNQWLPPLYQSMGILSFITGNKADAKAKLDKAVAVNSTDPVTYMLLGSLSNEEYQQLATKHKEMAAGPMKDQTLKDAHIKLDEVIDMFAHAVALSEGNAQYQALHDQLLVDLTTYYKYRNSGKTDGLQALIDKYKKPATNQ
jgi:tetratricopeptide (TPR) repeat protein